ncbi:MAG: Fic family protein [Spirochaetota bacterium]|nr:Fic family protein [Spirochaetota bacterium]
MLEEVFYQLDDDLEKKINKIEALRSEIQQYYSLTPKQLIEIRKKYFAHVLYHCYLINLSGITIKDLEEIVLFDRVTGDLRLSEYLSIYRKIKTLFYIEKESSDSNKSLSVHLIQKLYLLLYWEEETINDSPFALPYRDSMAIVDDKCFSFPLLPVSEIPYRLEKLVDEYLQQETNLSPLLLASQFQYKFLEISPFKKGNEEISFYIFHYLTMSHGYPPIIFPSTNRTKYRESLNNVLDDQYYSLYDSVLEETIFSLEYLIKLLKQAKNKAQISPAGYFSSVIKEIKTSEKGVTRFKIQKEIDENAISNLITVLERGLDHYLMENPFEELRVTYKKALLKDIMHSYQLYDIFAKHEIKPLWKLISLSDKGIKNYMDTLNSIILIEFNSEQLYIPNSIVYIGVIPTKEGNFLFSILNSTYLDFKREEKYSKNLSFFRYKKGGIQLSDWDQDVINNFINESMKEFFDMLIEKINERKRILKNEL